MSYTLFAICAYILMRAFEVMFADQKEQRWYRLTMRVVAGVVLYEAVAGMAVFYFDQLRPLGFSAK